jgi:hypothetical protein
VLIEYLYDLLGQEPKVVVEIAPGVDGCTLETVNERSALLPHEGLLLTFIAPPKNSLLNLYQLYTRSQW